MKRLTITALLAVLLIASTAYAAPNYRGTSETLYPAGTPVIQVFDNYSVVGEPVAISPNFLPDQGSWQVVPFGNLSTWTISIEGSLVSQDGPYWPLSTMTEASTDLLRHYNAKPAPFLRAIISDQTGSGHFDLYHIKRGN